jgi:phosphomannomutase
MSAQEYVSWDPNEETREQVKAMISAGDNDSLSSIMKGRLAFGTAGLRGAMGPGFNRMNDLVILQTSQGLCRYLESELGAEEAKARGILIGYDHRSAGTLSSRGFALMTAAVFLSQGFNVYFCTDKNNDFVPTPLVAFGLKLYNCCAGIMVTASHNPKIDNGYKVYWGNGPQIIPPHDKGIATAIAQNLSPWQAYDTSSETIFGHSNLKEVTGPVADRYLDAIAGQSSFVDSRIFSDSKMHTNDSSGIKVAYTAMHGVGRPWLQAAFKRFQLPMPLIVPSQAEPDPTFPTVSFPNPEEKGALDKAMEFATANRCSLILANDPDADRLAAAEWIPEEDRWHLFSGNEIGVLLGDWAIQKRARAIAAGAEAKPSAVLASVVSSRMLKTIAESNGVAYYDTLTGFKWLGNKAVELRQQGTDVLFLYEEALGYCLGDVIPDKDGISAAAVFAEMAGFVSKEGKGHSQVYQHLKGLSSRYGEFVSLNSYVFSHDEVVTDRIFKRVREGGPDGGYWTECAGVAITVVVDITNGFDSSAPGGKSTLPATPGSHMIMFSFENGCSVTLRTSGTEPKIKYYTEIAGAPGQPRDEVAATLDVFVNQVVDNMLQPDENGLKRA